MTLQTQNSFKAQSFIHSKVLLNFHKLPCYPKKKKKSSIIAKRIMASFKHQNIFPCFIYKANKRIIQNSFEVNGIFFVSFRK